MRTLIGLPSMTLLSRIRCSLDGSGGDRRRACDCRWRSEALKGQWIGGGAPRSVLKVQRLGVEGIEEGCVIVCGVVRH